MAEGKEKISVTPATIYRIVDHLNLPRKPSESLRVKADVLIEDAIAKRVIAKAGKVLEEKIERERLLKELVDRDNCGDSKNRAED